MIELLLLWQLSKLWNNVFGEMEFLGLLRHSSRLKTFNREVCQAVSKRAPWLGERNTFSDVQ